MGTRKLILAALVGLVFAALFAGPALAQQRDPFDPLISEESEANAPAAPSSEPAQPASQPAQPSGNQGLPFTGADVSPFLAVAYLLVVVGVASLVIARLRTVGQEP